MHDYDEAVIQCFLQNQGRLFPEPVAETPEEAEEFLSDCMAVVVDSADEVAEYFEEAGLETGGEDPLEESEVFDVGDGRYLIVEG